MALTPLFVAGDAFLAGRLALSTITQSVSVLIYNYLIPI